MLPVVAAAVALSCAPGSAADALLGAFYRAAAPTSAIRTLSARYAYQGHGLMGSVSTTVDLMDGRFLETVNAGPDQEATAFNGQIAWMRDTSGVFSPQQGGNKTAIARNAAYRNANLWWQPGHGGAAVEQVSCDTLRITPRGGEPFDAVFDPATHLLKSVREAQSFGESTTTQYSGYDMRQRHLLPTLIATLTNDDPDSRETLHLTSVRFRNAPATAAFQMPTTRPRDWTLPAAGRVRVPIRLINNHIIADVRINAQGPFPFIIDTGGHDILTPATVQRLALVSKGNTPAFGAGENAASSGYSHVATIELGGAVLRDQTVATIDFSPRAVEGVDLGGMLGVEFIERFVVRIDYGSKTMTVMDPRRFDRMERQAAGTAVPFLFYEHMPQIGGRLDGRDLRLDIDTGSRAEVTLTSPFVQSASLLSAYPGGVSMTDGWGVGGAAHSYVARVGALALGSVTVPNVIAGLSSAKAGAFADEGSDGNVGSGLLKRFVVTLDYPRHTLYLSRLAAPDPDTGHFDRVGIWINLADDGLRIMDVAAGSPAEAAGLKVGDTITQLNGQPVAGRELSDLRRELKLVPVGTRCSIEYRRGNQSGTAVVIPRELIPAAAPTPQASAAGTS